MSKDRFPGDPFAQGQAGRGGDMEVSKPHQDAQNIPQSHRHANPSQVTEPWVRGEGPHLGVQNRVEFQPHSVITESLSKKKETHSSGVISTENIWAALPTRRKSMGGQALWGQKAWG